MFAWLRNPWVWISAGCVVAIAGVVAVIGFLTDNWLLAIIAVLVMLLVVVGVLLVRMIVRREREDQLERGLADDAQLEEARARAAQSAAGADLKSRFREALAEIKRTLGGRGGVYEVPWYLVIGSTGSGKSALLAECGLDLPAEYARSRQFGPTQTCDFFLFNEAIVLDTAGRYFSSDSEVDRSEWQLLLGQLRSSRVDCATNGVVFTIPAPTLLTLGPEELEDQARQLRRRLNEIKVALGVDAPVYIVVTKSDQIEGFTEFASALPADRLAEAFGWTNDQRRLADAGERIATAFSAICSRLDGMVHQLVMREPDAVKKRRIFVFPQELEEVGRAVARFASAAFKRDIYNVTPFLRGVYLASARAAGEAVSPTLHRLGQGWGLTQHGAGAPSPRYLRELFREVILGDEELALPESRLGAVSRRAILGAGGVMALGVALFWGASFAQNYTGTHELARTAKLALSSDPTIHHVNALREGIEHNDLEARTYVNRLGFGMLGRSLFDAKRTFVSAFGRNFDRYTRQNLERALRQDDDTRFRAGVTAATDLEYLDSRGATPAPDLTPYMPSRVKDPDGYHAAYYRFVEWMRPPDRTELRDRERDTLARWARQILKLGELERQTKRLGGRFPPIRYEDAGLVQSESRSWLVPGIYTRAGFEGLFGRLVAAVEDTGAVSRREISELKRRYVDRYDESWRRYLLHVPTDLRSDSEVRKSPHLKILEQIHTHTDVELIRDAGVPTWIEMVSEVRRTEVSGEEEKVAPYTEYIAAIENVAIDVEDAVGDPEQALLLAREVAEGKPSSFSDALQVVRRIVPRQGDAAARGKLRDVLESPILDGFSALLVSAHRELDRHWRERVSSRFSAPLTGKDFTDLFDPSHGELAAFASEQLGPFYRDGASRRVLEDRGIEFDDAFLAWMARVERMQPGEQHVRLRGVPATVVEPHGLRVKLRELRLVCPDESQVFLYREGGGAKTFRWDPSCQSLTLRIVVGGPSGRDREFSPEWTGPLALPNFLNQGEAVGGKMVQWIFEGPDGIRVKARYEIESGGEIRDLSNLVPPTSLGS